MHNILHRCPQVAELSREDRLRLAREIVEIEASLPDGGPVFGDGSLDLEIFEAMLKRVEAYEADPSLGTPVEEALNRVFATPGTR